MRLIGRISPLGQVAVPVAWSTVKSSMVNPNTPSGPPNGWTTMNIALPGTQDGSALKLEASLRWWDRDTGCTVVVSQPSTEPDLWDEYLEGAQRSYRKHSVEGALDVEAIRHGGDTVLFWAVIDETGRVAAGVRAKGPLRSADESHALIEWAGRAGEQAVRKMITDRLPFGVIEMKTAFSTDRPHRNRPLAKIIARSGFHAMPLLGNQFCMATGAAQMLDRWRSSGGVLASALPPTPYPDERYRTKMMWWDRRTFAKHADPDQVSKIFVEIAEVGRRFHGLEKEALCPPAGLCGELRLADQILTRQILTRGLNHENLDEFLDELDIAIEDGSINRRQRAAQP